MGVSCPDQAKVLYKEEKEEEEAQEIKKEKEARIVIRGGRQ